MDSCKISAMQAENVIPFEQPDTQRDEYIAAIQHWRETRNVAETLSREEIGAMDWRSRMDAQRKSIIWALSEYYRENVRADVGPGVQVILTLLSDNDNGAASISQETLAKLLGRSRNAIYQAQLRLKKLGTITTERGRHAKVSPVIPRAMTTRYNHLAWTIQAIAQDNVNCYDGHSNSQLLCRTEQLNQLLCRTEQLNPVNCYDEEGSIARTAIAQIHTNNSTKLYNKEAKPAVAVAAAVVATALATMPLAANPVAPIEPPEVAQRRMEISASMDRSMAAKPATVGRTGLTVNELAAKLFEAGGRAMNRTAAGLEVMSIPRAWDAAGCDLEMDILPTIAAIAKRLPDNKLSTWSYFTNPIMEAMAKRTTPIQTATAKSASQERKPWDQQAMAESWLDKMIQQETPEVKARRAALAERERRILGIDL